MSQTEIATTYCCLQHFSVTFYGRVHVKFLRAAPLLLRRSGPLSQQLLCQCWNICLCIVTAMDDGIANVPLALLRPLSSSQHHHCKDSSDSLSGLVP